MIPGKFK